MRKLLLVIIISLFGALGLWALPSNAEAESYSIRTGALFNNPHSTEEDRLYLNNYINYAIDQTPKGETIRITTWRLNQITTKNRLIAAYKRGVNVKIIFPQGNESAETDELARVLGTKLTNKSFITSCSGSCRSSANGNVHAKIYTFSKTDGKSKVTIVGTANLARGVRESWNSFYTTVGNTGLYDFYLKFFSQARLDRNYSPSYMTKTSGIYTAYVFPKPYSTKPSSDPIWRELNNVKCSGATRGTGFNGKTLIRVSMYHWSGMRGNWLAQKLWSLDNQGCKVQVLFNTNAMSKTVNTKLKKTTKFGGIELRKANYPNGIYNHNKDLLISGNHRGKTNSRVIMTGSQNWTDGGLFKSDELVLKINSAGGAYDAYNGNFLNIWNNYSFVIR